MQQGTFNKEVVLDKLKQNRSQIKSYGVKSLGLFGSFVRNTPTEKSDIDLLVDFEPQKKTFDNFMELNFFLEELFDRKIELITTRSLGKYIGPYILNEVEDVGI